MARPEVSWFPARYLSSFERCGFPPLEDWLAQAYVLGLRQVELPWEMLPGRTPEVLRAMARRLDHHALRACAVHCSTRFAGPEPEAGGNAHLLALSAARAARVFEAPLLVITAGPGRPDAPLSESLACAAEHIARLAEDVQRLGVCLCLANDPHPRDPGGSSMLTRSEAFLELLGRLESSPVRVCVNTGAPLISAQDPSALLEAVLGRVAHVHLSDRLPGGLHNTTCGNGAVDFRPIFQLLCAAGYQGALSLEDDDPAARTQQSITFLRERIAQYWR